MKDGDKKMETKEEEKKAEPVKTLDVLDVVRPRSALFPTLPTHRSKRRESEPDD